MADWDGTERRRSGDDFNVLATRLESLHQDVGEVKSALNALTSAITKLAIIEEKQTTAAVSLERAFTAISKIESRLLELEKLVPLNNRNNIWMERSIVAVVGAAAMFIWDHFKRGQ